MSLDYTKILPKELKSVDKFKKWMEFWDLGEPTQADNDIQEVMDKVLSEIRNRSALLCHLNGVKERLEDITHYISKEELETNLLNSFLLKLDKDFSAFKSRVILDEDTFYGMVLNGFNKTDTEDIEKEQSISSHV
jgi:hypothetical protein